MFITSEILQKLKCSNCECYLSRPPIFAQENGDTFCGRCNKPDGLSIRMLPYENLLPILSFPCMYQQDGCLETIPFHKIKAHEEACKHKKYACPVVPSGTCDFIVTHQLLYKHCNDKHLHRIVEHPCVLRHSITENSFETYVTHHSGYLFLIHAKVSMLTNKIYHSVHYVGDVSDLTELKFRIDIRRGEETIIKNGVIQPLGSKVIQESSSVVCGINGLLELFNGFDGTTFTIYILLKSKNGLKCEICEERDRQYFGKYCAVCVEKRRPCSNEQKGCTYIDIPRKCEKHAALFCRFQNWCMICKEIIDVNYPMYCKHYQIAHKNRTFNANEYWKINLEDILSTSNEFYFIISTFQFDNCIGCITKIDASKIGVILSSSKITENIRKYVCIIKIKSKNGNKIMKVVPFTVDGKEDWRTTFKISTDDGLLVDLKETFVSFDIRKRDN